MPQWPLEISSTCGRVKIPQGRTAGMCGLLLGIVGLCKAAGRLFQAIASAFELDEHAAVHETVQDGGGEGGDREHSRWSEIGQLALERVGWQSRSLAAQLLAGVVCVFSPHRL